MLVRYPLLPCYATESHLTSTMFMLMPPISVWEASSGLVPHTTSNYLPGEAASVVILIMLFNKTGHDKQ